LKAFKRAMFFSATLNQSLMRLIVVLRSRQAALTHAAIGLGDKEYAEMTSDGVATGHLIELLDWCDYIAIFRQPLWSDRRKLLLRRFALGRAEDNPRFNYRGALKLDGEKRSDDFEICENLEAFFRGQHEPKSPVRPAYFCSEFVAAAFIAVGILDKSAAVAYPPEKVSPIGLSKDPTYGLFCGYLAAPAKASIPETDEFYYETTFAEICS
jgi:hypothetical protein